MNEIGPCPQLPKTFPCSRFRPEVFVRESDSDGSKLFRGNIERLASVALAAIGRGRFDRALVAYESLIEHEPANPRHHLHAANCLARLSRIRAAALAYCEAARLFTARGRERQALAVWRIAHLLDPSYERAASGLRDAESCAR
jgi:hypothetical protein